MKKQTSVWSSHRSRISKKGCTTDFVNMNIVDFVAIIRILANDISGEYSPQVPPYYAFIVVDK